MAGTSNLFKVDFKSDSQHWMTGCISDLELAQDGTLISSVSLSDGSQQKIPVKDLKWSISVSEKLADFKVGDRVEVKSENAWSTGVIRIINGNELNLIMIFIGDQNLVETSYQQDLIVSKDCLRPWINRVPVTTDDFEVKLLSVSPQFNLA